MEFQHGRFFRFLKAVAVLLVGQTSSFRALPACVFLMQEAPGGCLFGLVEARGEVDYFELEN